ncbi:MAG: FKBP-type peptidyl-prolyl cis-trans isomerase [Saprospiraceae bacterium]|nr:FKBP-type peptidyl-prolyl cis-trans isomerase [Saprospiraceae bacterium]
MNHIWKGLCLLLLLSNLNSLQAQKSTQDSVGYAYGVLIGKQLKAMSLNDKDLSTKQLYKGLSDVLKYGEDNEKIKISPEQAEQILSKFFEMKAEEEAEQSVQKEKDWFAENVDNKEGVGKTASGIRYEVLKKGEGKQPLASDQVTVHYHGTLIDGTIFDSSVDRGEPATFVIQQLIPAWVEIIPMMKEGGKWKIYVPFDQAYGAQGAGGSIPPYSTLIFEIELISVGSDDQ